MQYAIFDNVTGEYLCDDNSWIVANFSERIIKQDINIKLFGDEDKAIAMISEIKTQLLNDIKNAEVDYALHMLTREVCYLIEPVTDNSVLRKIKEVNCAK